MHMSYLLFGAVWCAGECPNITSKSKSIKPFIAEPKRYASPLHLQFPSSQPAVLRRDITWQRFIVAKAKVHVMFSIIGRLIHISTVLDRVHHFIAIVIVSSLSTSFIASSPWGVQLHHRPRRRTSRRLVAITTTSLFY